MPRIKTTRTARIALWALRIYLLVLLALIGLKFARMFGGGSEAMKLAPPPVSSASPKSGP
jgi:hypothetical protein